MNDMDLEKLRRKYGGDDNPTPPADLLNRLKSDVPDGDTLARQTRGASVADHPAAWRLAASVIMLFGFAFVAARIYLDSRADDYVSYPATYADARSRSASTEPQGNAAPPAEMAPAPSVAEANQPKPASPPPDRIAAKESLQRVDKEPAGRRNDSAGFAPSIASTPALSKSEREEDGRVYETKTASNEVADELKKDNAVTLETAPAAAPAPPPAVMAQSSVRAKATAERDAQAPSRGITGSTAGAARQEPSDADVYSVGGDVHVPVLLEDHPLKVTRAEAASVREKVSVDIIVNADGSVRSVHVATPLPSALKQRVIDAVSLRRYRAGTLDGEAVAVRIRTNVRLDVH